MEFKLGEGCTKSELKAATLAAMVAGQLVPLQGIWNDKRNKVLALRVADTIEKTSGAKK